MDDTVSAFVALICTECFAKRIMERLLYLTYFLIKIKADGRMICPKRSGITVNVKSTTLRDCISEYMKDQIFDLLRKI